MAPPMKLLTPLPFFVFNNEAFLLQRKSGQSVKIKQFGKFRLVREKFGESSRGIGNPLELLIGHFLVAEWHNWLHTVYFLKRNTYKYKKPRANEDFPFSNSAVLKPAQHQGLPLIFVSTHCEHLEIGATRIGVPSSRFPL